MTNESLINEVEGFRLSPQQKSLWLMREAEPEYPFAGRACISIEGTLNIDRLKRATQTVLDRHEIFRSVFRQLPGMGEPLQVIADRARMLMEEHDLVGIPDVNHVRVLDAIYQKLRCPALDQAPVAWCALVKVSPEKHFLILVLPVLCADWETLAKINQEIREAYVDLSSGGTRSNEVMQYADFAAWQNELLEGENSRDGWGFWIDQKAGLNSSHGFVWKNTGTKGSTPHCLEPQRNVSFKEIDEFCRTRELDVPVFLVGCLHLLLRRLTGSANTIVGNYCDGRNYEELKDLMGPVGRYLPLKGVFIPGAKASSVIEEVARTDREVRQWQEYFCREKVMRGEQGESLYFRYGFEFREVRSETETADIQLHICRQDLFLEPFQVKLSVTRTGDSLAIQFQHDPEHVNEKQMEAFAGHYHLVLEQVPKNPDVPADQLQILSASERKRFLEELNDTRTDYPRGECLHELFERQAKLHPKAIAVMFEGRRLTYRELDLQADRLASRLQAMGVGPEVRVGVCIERSLDMVVGLLGILKAGGAYVPLDAAYPKERLRFMLEDAQVPILLAQERTAAFLDRLPAKIIRIDKPAQWDDFHAEHRPSAVAPGNLAYVIYTSGSSGQPKGVMITHQAICNHMFWMQRQFPVGPDDKVFQKTPFSFDASVWEFYAPLLSGGCLVMARPDGHRDPAYLVETVQNEGVTILQLVPSLLRLLLEESALGNCKSLRRVFCGGEPLDGDLQIRFFERMSRVNLHNLYGPTEATIDATAWTCDRCSDRQQILIGGPIDNVQAYVLNEHIEVVPAGFPAELYLGGEGLARGYLNQPGLTAEKFIPNPFGLEAGARLYRTGDLCRHHEMGGIEFLGRMDQQVKVRGHRIELGEIEAALKKLSGVSQAVAIAREDEPGQKRLIGYIVAKPGKTPGAEELRTQLLELLPEYMVPSGFVLLERFPLMPNGKVDRHALPTLEIKRPENSFVAAQRSAEIVLADIWAKVLRLERVGIHDNFFALGGDSILTIQIVARANEAGLKLTPRQLFEHQTIAELAKEAGQEDQLFAEQQQVDGEVLLTPIQQRFFVRELEEPYHFNQSVLLEVGREVEEGLVRQVIQALVRHHDGLRLRFERVDGGWRQVNAPAEEHEIFSNIDISGVARAEQGRRITAEANTVQASLDLAHGPIIRVVWFALGAGQTARLMIVIHHLAVDGVSWRILLEDLQRGHRQLKEGGAIDLGRKTTSYRQWADRLNGYARSETVKKELDYWNHAGSGPWEAMISEKVGGENRAGEAENVTGWLNEEETRSLLQSVPEKYHTQINDALLAALARAYEKWSGRKRMWVDLEGHGREDIFEDVDLTRTVGWFTTIYPVRLEVEERMGPGDVLKSVKEQLRQIPNRGFGYGLLKYLNPEGREAAERWHAVEISFNYLGQLDQALEVESMFKPADESVGRNMSRKTRREYLLEISSSISRGRLGITFRYGKEFHSAQKIEALMEKTMSALRELINYCRSEGAGGYTPSDFQLAKLSQEELDRLMAKMDVLKPQV